MENYFFLFENTFNELLPSKMILCFLLPSKRTDYLLTDHEELIFFSLKF